jgi:hypothetical protein
MNDTEIKVCPWNLHILGPDDIIPHVTEIAALREANALNLMMAEEKLKHANDPNHPWSMAIVEARAGDLQPVPPETVGVKAVASKDLLAGDYWKKIQLAEFLLRFRMPGEMQYKEVKMTIDANAVDCLRPLSRNREIEWEISARNEAIRMKEDRRRLAEYIGRCYAVEIENALAGKDTINGYTPEEWAAINPKPANAH